MKGCKPVPFNAQQLSTAAVLHDQVTDTTRTNLPLIPWQ